MSGLKTRILLSALALAALMTTPAHASHEASILSGIAGEWVAQDVYVLEKGGMVAAFLSQEVASLSR